MSDSELNPVAVAAQGSGNVLEGLREVFQNRLLLLRVFVFMAANFVAMVFLTWMPTFCFRSFI